MPPVRNTHYVNVNDRSSNALHLGANQVIESKMPIKMQPQMSPNMVTSLPPVQHPSGSQQPIQQTPLTKAELRKVNAAPPLILIRIAQELCRMKLSNKIASCRLHNGIHANSFGSN